MARWRHVGVEPVKNYHRLLPGSGSPLAIGFGHGSQYDPLFSSILIKDERHKVEHRLGAGVGEQVAETFTLYDL